MRVGCDHEGSRRDISALHHDLMTDAGTRRIEVDAMLFRKCLDGPIFLVIGFVLVLDVVIECEDKLLWVVNLLGADAFELTHYRRGIVVGHHMMRPDRDEVPGPQ